MHDNLIIRDEVADDADAIAEVTVDAFRTLAISRHTEQFIVAALRAARSLAVSLVAELDGKVVGHIAFSPVTISDGTTGWYGLGPVSVTPALQGRGIGSALIKAGLDRLRHSNAGGCCLVGHPAYYPRFGFRMIEGLVCEGVPPEVFLALPLAGNIPQGKVAFHPGFFVDGPPPAAG